MSNITIKPNPKFGKLFRPTAVKAWDAFFKHADESCRLAHWWILPYSSNIQLTGFNIDMNACEDEATVTPYIFITVDAFFELIGPADVMPTEDQIESYQSWAIKGIKEAFELKTIQAKYKKSGLSDLEFAVTWSPHQEGFDYDPDLRVISANTKRLTPAAIRKRQSAADKT
ncbi:MAG: hypothetical protein AAGB26_02040 [Planctomycetota bacterium]